MTTVVFDGKTIACDSQVTTKSSDGYATKGVGNKGRLINTVAGPALVIGVGWLSEYLEAIPCLEAGQSPELTEGETEIIMVKDGKVYCISSGYPRGKKKPKKKKALAKYIDGPDAWGSGDLFANVALKLKATAPRAVATSCKMDLYSGGKIHAWDVSSLRKLKVCQKTPKIV